MKHTRRVLVALALSLVVAAVCVRVSAQATPQTAEKWQADLVLSSANGTPLLYPNDFVENPTTHELLVADSFNNRIVRYAADAGCICSGVTGHTGAWKAGDFVGVISGTSSWGFNRPYGLAVDAVGNIVVANTGIYGAPDDLIQVLSSDGNSLLNQVRLGSLPTISGAQVFRVTLEPGTTLSGATPTGKVYLITGGPSRVYVLNAGLDTILKSFPDQNSTDPLDYPTGLAVDGSGRVYVSDPNNSRVQVYANPFSTNPADVDSFGKPIVVASICDSGPQCTTPSNLAYPFGLAIDANGRLLVADPYNNQIAVFSSFANGLKAVPANIGIATTGVNGPNLALWSGVAGPCYPYDAAKPCLPDFLPTGLTLPSDMYPADLQLPTNIELDHLGHLLVADSNNMRVQRFVQPTMTLATSVSGSPFTTGSPITISVTASTTEPGGLKNVTPTATPQAFTGAQCGAASIDSLVTTPTPQSYVVNGTTSTTPPVVPLLSPGSPVTFTMVFYASSGSGPLVFSAGATGTTVVTNLPASQQRSLDSIAINSADTSLPTTTLTSTPAIPDGNAISSPGVLGWFISANGSAPVIHLTASAGASEIDWSTSDQDASHDTPSGIVSVQCGTTKDITITRNGSTQIFYRSVNPSGTTENWNKVIVKFDSGPNVDLTLTPNANVNNWYNAPVTVNWTATAPTAGLSQVDWSATTVNLTSVQTGATVTAANSFPVSGQGAAMSGTVKAWSNSGASTSASIPFRIDTVAPIILGTHPINEMGTQVAATLFNGWYHKDVDVIFSATDNLSGFNAASILSQTQAIAVTGDGSALAAPVNFTDQAGNSAIGSVAVNIDRVPPTVSASLAGVVGGWLTSAGTLTFTANDATSGVQKVHYDVVNAQGQTTSVDLTNLSALSALISGVGKNTVTYYAIDNALNQSVPQTINVWINRPLTLTAIADTKVYDGTTASNKVPTAVGLIGNDSGTFVETFNTASVGSKTMTPAAASFNPANTEHYTVTTVTPAPGTITAKSVTASITAANKPFDGNTTATVTCTLSGVVASETVTCAPLAANFSSATVGNNKTVTATGITISGPTASNYSLTSQTATTTANITGNASVLTATILAVNKVYDGTTSATTTCSLTGVAPGDQVTCSAAAANFASAGVGNNKTVTVTGITLAGAQAASYTLAATTATVTANITPKPLTAVITASNKTYDTTAAATVTSCALPGVVGSDVVTCTTGPGAFASASVGNGKTVTANNVAIAGASVANYSLTATSATTTANITPVTLTATIAAQTKVYDGTTAAPGATCAVSGVLAGDTVACSTVATFATAGVGNGKTVTGSNSLSGASAGNYSVGSATTTANITAKPLTVGITAASKVYNGTNAATITGCTLTGVVNGDTVTCSVANATFADANVGNGKTVTGTGIALAGTSAANYSVAATATTTANITPAPTTTTLVASATSVPTGQPVTFTATVGPTGSTAGSIKFTDGANVLGTVLVNGNTASLLTTTLAVGSHTVIATFVPSSTNVSGSASNAVTVVVTNQPPVCTAAVASPGQLWPPNHKFTPISINGVTDPEHDALTIAVTKIWQDESTMADGSGDTAIDGMITGGAAQVRAERSGEGDGRVYEIFFKATDSMGNSCTGSVTVGVPHDQSGGPVVDSGVRYDSLVTNGPVVAGTAPNRAPVAVADASSTLKGVAKTLSVLANDSDPDHDTLTIIAVTAPAHGTATISANKTTITYTPAAGFGGTDSFTYTVSDGRGKTATATVTMTVNAHTDGDGCPHDQHRGGTHDNDGSDHDRDTHHTGDNCDHEQHRNGHRDGDGCDHDKSTHSQHHAGDGDDHDQHRNGHHDGDGCDHDRAAHAQHYAGDGDDHDKSRNGHRAGDGCDHDRDTQRW